MLEDVAIDYLEQTPITLLNPDNILDAEGIKKITELTATQKILANQIDREREKTITKQNVEGREDDPRAANGSSPRPSKSRSARSPSIRRARKRRRKRSSRSSG